jgi:hypothetical protein
MIFCLFYYYYYYYYYYLKLVLHYPVVLFMLNNTKQRWSNTNLFHSEYYVVSLHVSVHTESSADICTKSVKHSRQFCRLFALSVTCRAQNIAQHNSDIIRNHHIVYEQQHIRTAAYTRYTDYRWFLKKSSPTEKNESLTINNCSTFRFTYSLDCSYRFRIFALIIVYLYLYLGTKFGRKFIRNKERFTSATENCQILIFLIFWKENYWDLTEAECEVLKELPAEFWRLLTIQYK